MSQPELNKRICRLNRIFADNGWLNTESSQVMINHALDQCIEIATMLDGREFDLFCDLLRKYILFQFEWYIPAFGRVLDKIIPDTKSGHTYNLVPLIAPKDTGKIKSGNAALYNFANTTWSRSRLFNRMPLKTFSDAQYLQNTGTDNSNSTILVIDDFIGSGDTALEFIGHYNNVLQSHKRAIFIALVAMKTGLNTIKNNGFMAECDVVAEKGIADCNNMKGGAQFYEIMAAIESKIELKPKFNFGYKSSEALVTMQRTPNNTFPIFWASHLKGGQQCPALFPRR